MSKFISNDNLNKLSKALYERFLEIINEEISKVNAVEEMLQADLVRVENMLGGKSIVYITQADYDNLTDEEKENELVTYFVVDAVDLSHKHDNQEFLDNLEARNITIGECSQVFNGAEDLSYSIADMGVAPAVHSHDDLYYTETEMDTTLSELQSDIEGKLDEVKASKSDITHLHDDRYYTETEIDNKFGDLLETIMINDSKLWVGTQDDYNSLENHNSDTMYLTLFDYDKELGFDTDELVFNGGSASTTAVLNKARLNRLILK